MKRPEIGQRSGKSRRRVDKSNHLSRDQGNAGAILWPEVNLANKNRTRLLTIVRVEIGFPYKSHHAIVTRDLNKALVGQRPSI